MAKTLTQGDIKAWAKIPGYWTPVRTTIARAAALAEQRFVRASGNRHAKCAATHEHYWTVEQIEKDLDEAGFVIMSKAEVAQLVAEADRATGIATDHHESEPAPQPVRRGPGRPRKVQQDADA